MKKNFFYLIITLSIVLLFSGCSSTSVNTEEETSAERFPEFELNDLDGNTLDNSIFSENKITLLNLWGTFCSPCVREMPEIDKLYKEKAKDGLGVFGIVTDGNAEIAREIVDALIISYKHIIPTEEFSIDYLSNFEYVPTTIFVNSDGEIVGEVVVGARSYDEFKEIVEKLLKETN